MKIHIVMAQRRGNYPGQYGLEALAVMSEADYEENPDWIENSVAENRSTGEFESIEIVTVEVSEAAIKKVLYPNREAIRATVVEGE
jgi:hypothetical protein